MEYGVKLKVFSTVVGYFYISKNKGINMSLYLISGWFSKCNQNRKLFLYAILKKKLGSVFIWLYINKKSLKNNLTFHNMKHYIKYYFLQNLHERYSQRNASYLFPQKLQLVQGTQ